MFCHSSLMTEAQLVVDKWFVEVPMSEQITPIVIAVVNESFEG